jgi:hypothetical protein
MPTDRPTGYRVPLFEFREELKPQIVADYTDQKCFICYPRPPRKSAASLCPFAEELTHQPLPPKIVSSSQVSNFERKISRRLSRMTRIRNVFISCPRPPRKSAAYLSHLNACATAPSVMFYWNSNRVPTEVVQKFPSTLSSGSRAWLAETAVNSSPLGPSCKVALILCVPSKTPVAL